MRIGLSCTTLEPSLTVEKIDGIGTYTKNIHEELISRGVSVTPISFPNKFLKRSDLPNGKLFPWSYGASILLSRLTPLSFSNQTIESNIELFHSTDHMIPKFKKIPVIATIHDGLMFQSSPFIPGKRLTYLKILARKKSLDWASHVITGSSAMIPELIESCGIHPEKISVVPDGISPWWFEALSEEKIKEVLKTLRLPSKFVLFAGTLHPKKNLPRLIDAYLELPEDLIKEYPLIIVGKKGWNANESLSAIQKLEAKKGGRWLNYVTIDELRILFQAATVYLHPSLHEGFGLTLLQSFASKTPVLTSNITAMPETAGGAAYLVDPYSVLQIKEGIKKLLINSTLRQELILKGETRVQEFSWQKCVDGILKVYQAVLSGKKIQ